MDLWKYFAIGHEGMAICNPLSSDKLDELIELLALPDDARIVDIACGKGELLVRAAKRWHCRAVGVDISPYFVTDARVRIAEAGLEPEPEIIEGSGSDYRADSASYDAAVCIGASWIWGGLAGTLRALSTWARPGGLVVVGEPFWRRDPSPDHLESAGMTASSMATHRGNIETGVDQGLGVLHAIVSSADDWDRYAGYQWNASERYARQNPADPDVAELIASARKSRDHYLRWGRDEVGWAVYLFVKDPYTAAR